MHVRLMARRACEQVGNMPRGARYWLPEERYIWPNAYTRPLNALAAAFKVWVACVVRASRPESHQACTPTECAEVCLMRMHSSQEQRL